MTEFAWLLVGLLLGGCVSIAMLCCIQINRISDYETEIQRLEQELNKKM